MLIEIINGKAYKVAEGRCSDCCLYGRIASRCIAAELCHRGTSSFCYAELQSGEIAAIISAMGLGGEA